MIRISLIISASAGQFSERRDQLHQYTFYPNYSGGNLQNYYEGTSIWHFDFFSFPFQYHYCSYIPHCFCEACSN